MPYLKDFTNFNLDNEEIQDYYLYNEFDTITISFDEIKNASYSIVFSTDGVSWLNISSYDNRMKKEVVNGKVNITIKVSYQFFKAIIKVIAISGTKEVVSLPINLYSRLSFLYSDEVLNYIYKNNKSEIFEMNLFN